MNKTNIVNFKLKNKSSPFAFRGNLIQILYIANRTLTGSGKYKHFWLLRLCDIFQRVKGHDIMHATLQFLNHQRNHMLGSLGNSVVTVIASSHVDLATPRTGTSIFWESRFDFDFDLSGRDLGVNILSFLLKISLHAKYELKRINNASVAISCVGLSLDWFLTES